MAQEKTLCFYNLSFFLLPSSSCGVNTALSVYPKCHITVYALNPSVMDVCLCELRIAASAYNIYTELILFTADEDKY